MNSILTNNSNNSSVCVCVCVCGCMCILLSQFGVAYIYNADIFIIVPYICMYTHTCTHTHIWLGLQAAVQLI